MTAGRPDLRWRREHAVWQLFQAGALLLPRPLVRPLARAVARAVELFLPGTAAAIRENMGRILALPPGAPPARAAREVRRRARRALASYGEALFDHAWLTLGPRDRAAALVARVEGRERLDAALRGGAGAVLATAHMGLWDLGAHALARAGLRLSVVALAGGDPRMNRYRDRPRRRLGIEILWVEPGEGLAVSLLGPLRALRERRVVAILADRPTGGAAARLPFFGAPAALPLGPAALARAAGVPIVPAFVVRDARTRGYLLAIEPPIVVARTADARADIEAATAALARVLERWIRAYPEQWYCFYPFWRERPGAGSSG